MNIFHLTVNLFVDNIAHKGFAKAELDQNENDFVRDNIAKHCKSLQFTVASWPFTLLGLYMIRQDTTIVLAIVFGLGTLAAALIGAWFNVTFGGIKEKLSHIGMDITYWMYTAMNVSTSASLISLGWITPWPFWVVLAFIYFAFMMTTIMYDTVDGLKVGLDETVQKHGRYAIAYYEKQGVDYEQEDK